MEGGKAARPARGHVIDRAAHHKNAYAPLAQVLRLIDRSVHCRVSRHYVLSTSRMRLRFVEDVELNVQPPMIGRTVSF